MSLRQETITKWVDGIDKGSIVKPYFYLDWDIKNNMSPSIQATWYHKIPSDKKVTWRKVVKIGYREVSLCSSYTPLKSDELNTGGSVYNSFLQSHLQKAVRRKNKRAAVFTTDLLLELSPLKLIRRLPIIMVEDAFIHKSFSTLIWLMCSMSIKNDRRELHENQKKWILGVVYLITTLNYKEHISHDTTNWVFPNHLSEIHKIKNLDVQDVIYSVETRRCYGGMKGDDVMFQSYEKKCIDIFSYGDNDKWSSFFYRKVRPILTKKTLFKQKEWLMEGYDFHCYPSLLGRLEEEFPEYDQDEHKRTIWFKSSGVNFKAELDYDFEKRKYIHIPKNYIPDNITQHWNKIRRFIRRKAWGFVQGMLENLNMMYPEWIDYVPYQPPEIKESNETLLVTESNCKNNKEYSGNEE